MSPTSYQLLHPALFGFTKVVVLFGNRKQLVAKSLSFYQKLGQTPQNVLVMPK
jgi:hypothetical protein